MVSLSTGVEKTEEGIIRYAREVAPFCDMLHCDIMDGKFVPAKTYGADTLKKINAACTLPLDVHLMVDLSKKPQKIIEQYISAGANIVTVHYEAFSSDKALVRALAFIRESGALAGITMKPSTPLSKVKLFMYNVDVVMVMSVEPGASGQRFLPSSLDRIREINKFRCENNLKFKLEVDGGITGEVAKQCNLAGADILVSGSYVYKAENRKEAIEKLKLK